MKKLIVLILIVFILTGCTDKGLDTSKVPINKEESGSGDNSASNKPSVGAKGDIEANMQTMPSFEAMNLDGRLVTSNDFKGKITIINFFNTWNLDTVKEIGILGEISKQYKDKELSIVYVNSTDKLEDIKKFGKEHPIIASHMILDNEGKLAKGFNVEKAPTTYIINRDLSVVARYARVINKDEMKLVLDALQ
ncbi:MAG: redoxin domain-containing protein [Clostridium sp.]